VFVVGCSGDGAAAAQVLFERESVCRDSAPRRAPGQGVTADAEGCAGTVSSKRAKGTGGPSGDECYNLTTQPVASTLGNRGTRSHTELDGHGAYIPLQQPVPYDLFQITAPVNRQNRQPGDPCHTLARDNAAHAAVAQAMTVRRLTTRECERLQGFHDDYTLIPWRKKCAEDCPDGPRYRALGNSMAVNVMAWIGERIDNYERTGNAVQTEG
jgi:DNA (cytosine-5)-methyltransferase 1